MMKIQKIFGLLLAICGVLFAGENVFAQGINPQNLNFERGRIGEFPEVWTTSEKTLKQGFILEKSSDARTGSGSLLFRCDSLRDTGLLDGLAYQAISPVAYLGKSVKFSAWAKAEYQYSATGSAFLWVKVYRSNKTFEIYPIDEAQYINSPDWQHYEVVAQVPADAIEIQFGVVLQSEGKVWLDDAEFDNVGSVEYSDIVINDKLAGDIAAFAKAFSAIAYHYPARSVDSLDYAVFAENAVEKLASADDSRKLESKLAEIFAPLGSKIRFGNANLKPNFYDNNRDNSAAEPQFRLYVGPKISIENTLTKVKLQNINIMQREIPAYLAQTIRVDSSRKRSAKFSALIKFNSPNQCAKAYPVISLLDSNLKIIKVILPERSGKSLKYEQTFSFPDSCRFLDVNLALEGDGGAIFDAVSCVIDGHEKISNGDFELGTTDWRFDEKCRIAGYELIKNMEKPIEGSISLELNVINGKYIKYPKMGDVEKVKLNENLYAYYPKIMYADEDTVQAKIDSEKTFGEFGSWAARIASVISAWALADNFALSKPKTTEIPAEAIQQAVSARTETELTNVIIAVLAQFPDGGIRVWHNREVDAELRGLPLNWDNIGGKVVITKSLVSDLPAGSEVAEINGEAIEKFLDKRTAAIPGSSKRLKILRVLAEMKYSEAGEDVVLKVRAARSTRSSLTEVTLSRSGQLDDLRIGSLKAEEFADGAFYIDPARFDEKSLMAYFRENSEKMRGIVFDMRGYNVFSEYFYKFFKTGIFKPTDWVMPYFADYGEAAESGGFRVMRQDVTGNGKLSNVKLVVLCDETTIGLNEANLYLLRKNSIAKSVGRETSGAPTELCTFPLPCDCSMSLSMLAATDEAGTLLIGKPFVPDIKIETKLTGDLSVDSIKEGGKKELLRLLKQ